MGGGTPRTNAPIAPCPIARTAPQSPMPHLRRTRPHRHSCALSPSFLRRQEPPHAPHHPLTTPTPPPIHPSPFQGGLGGGWNAASAHQRPNGRPRSSRAASTHPSFLRSSVIPAFFRHSCAGRNPPRTMKLRSTSEDFRRRSNATWADRRGIAARTDAGDRVVPACAGMTRGGAGFKGRVGRTEGERHRRSGRTRPVAPARGVPPPT